MLPGGRGDWGGAAHREWEGTDTACQNASPVPTTWTSYLGSGLSCAQSKTVFQKELSASWNFGASVWAPLFPWESFSGWCRSVWGHRQGEPWSSSGHARQWVLMGSERAYPEGRLGPGLTSITLRFFVKSLPVWTSVVSNPASVELQRKPWFLSSFGLELVIWKCPQTNMDGKVKIFHQYFCVFTCYLGGGSSHVNNPRVRLVFRTHL